MEYLQIVLLIFFLIVFHEIGHIIFAMLLNLAIQKIGFQFNPYPHFYVAVKWPKNKWQKYLYLFSGSFITIILFYIAVINNFFGLISLYWAFLIQFTIETNPFYSDFTIAIVNSNKFDYKIKSYAKNYNLQFKKYQFTLKWYIHFIIWTLLIFLLIKFKNQIL